MLLVGSGDEDVDLEAAARGLLAGLRAAERRCAFPVRRETRWREAAWARATDGYWTAGNLLEDLLGEHILPALAAEREARQEAMID